MSAASIASEWQVRGYRPGDEHGLAALFERVFGHPIGVERWRWKLKTRPSPVENVWLAERAGRPIFQYAGIPAPVITPGGPATAMVSVDTMTAPEFQRRGLLSAVGGATYAAWRAAGLPFVLGLPNERWGSRAAALGWRQAGTLAWLVRPLRPEALLARRLGLPALARSDLLGQAWALLAGLAAPPDPTVSLRPLAAAEPALDMVWALLAGERPLSLRRDAAWVGWRYLAAPGLGYRVLLAERAGAAVGYVAFRLGGSPARPAGLIADLQCAADDAGARSALAAAACRALREAGAASAAILAAPGSPLAAGLRWAGFLPGRGAFAVQVVPLAAELPADLLCDPGSWSLAGGDFDVV